MNETLEAQSPDGDVRVETFTWEVWQRKNASPGALASGDTLEHVGEIVSESNYRAWAWNGEQAALAEITRLAMGAGDFVLICGDRNLRVRIVAETVYWVESGEEQ